MTSIEQKLDIVIAFIKANNNYVSHGLLYNSRFKINEEIFKPPINSLELTNKQFIELLEIAKEDGYMTYTLGQQPFVNNDEVFDLRLTIKGKFFEGYEKLQIRNAVDDARIIRNEKLLRNYTLVLACGTVGLVIMEILTHWFDLMKLFCGCY